MSNERASLHVEFFMKAVELKAKSREAGRPIYEDREYVRIRFPGDPKRVLVAPVSDRSAVDRATGQRLTYAERFPEHYRLFRDGRADQMTGTPLSELPFLTEAKRAELRHQQVHTAEQLAGLPDNIIRKQGMGFRALVEQAQSYLDTAEGAAASTALAAENAELRDRLERLEEMMREGGKAPTEVAPAGPKDLGPGADFETWAPEDIRAFLKDITGSEPDKRLGKAKLVEMAAAEVAKRQESEAA